MRVERFVDQYDATAPAYGVSADQLRRRDERQGQRPQRWIAIDGDEVLGAVQTWHRPDDRLFLYFTGADASPIVPLSDAVVDALGCSVHTRVDASDADAVPAMRAAGFVTEAVEVQFRVRFEPALRAVAKARAPDGFAVVPADRVDVDRLFTLDNTVRQDVPGTDGWLGDRDWFEAELAESPPFDSLAYLVAIDESNGEYAGLVRVWRNPDGPRFGLIGVARQYRNTTIAAALLRQALTAAAEWGHDCFVAETSPDNPVIYRRMARLGARRTGRFLQMTRR